MSISYRFRFIKIRFLLVLLLVSSSRMSWHDSAAQPQEMILSLTSSQNEYVVREPIRLIVTLTNESNRPLNIFPLEEYDMNMEHLFIEVITPKDDKQLRRFSYYSTNSFISPEHYKGETLPPGKSLVMFLYPNESYLIMHPSQKVHGMQYEITFQEPGTYSVRAVYTVPINLKRIWKPINGELYSNALELYFRKPNAVESEILDAYWARFGDEFISIGDDHPYCCKFDEYALRNVIAKYPNDPMIKYAYFALAKLLSRPRRMTTFEMIDEARQICEMLMKKYPLFRYEEVRMNLARNYSVIGRKKDAMSMLNNLLIERPYIKDNVNFISEKITIEEQGVKGIAKWRKSRTIGIDKRMIKFKMY